MFTKEPQAPTGRSLPARKSIRHTEDSPSIFTDAFDPTSFRKNTEVVLSKLESYLSDSSIRGLKLTDPDKLHHAARQLMADNENFPEDSKLERLKEMIDLYIKTGIPVYSKGYMGRQFSGVVPLSGIMDFVSSMVSQPSSFYEAAQLPNVVEKIMAEELNQFIGWDPNQFTMVTTSGGSLANLTALLAARNDRYPDFWEKGMAAFKEGKLPAIAVSEDAHYSNMRAIGILGIGANQIVRLPINEKRQIDISKVNETLDRAAESGLDVFCMIASTGSTSVGAIDPIDQLADITNDRNIWLHVDGAHGASLLVSNQLRKRLKGMHKVDSLTWDAHKMMFMPAVCSLLFYKNKEKAKGAFQQKASYVFEKEEDIYTKLDSAEKNFECTKRPMIMPLWACWSIYGKKLFASKLEYLCKLTRDVYYLLKTEDDFETIHTPEANILCFRYHPRNWNSAIPEFQVAIRNQIKERCNFFISKIDLDGEGALRVVFMNHEIGVEHFKLLLDEIRIVGQQIIKGNQYAYEQLETVIENEI